MKSSKSETHDGSHVNNCIIMRRADDKSDALFTIVPDGSKLITKLDGYAIVPKEEYEYLMKLLG